MQKFLYRQKIKNCIILVFLFTAASCGSKVKQMQDDIYSRHLEAYISICLKLTLMLHTSIF